VRCFKFFFVIALAAAFVAVVRPARADTPAPDVNHCIAAYSFADESLKRLEAETGIPRAAVWAIVWKESHCQSDVVGASGEIGLAQIVPRDTAQLPAAWFTDRPTTIELMDAQANVYAAAKILRQNRDRYCRGDLMCALRVYNGGTSKCVIGGGRDSRAMPAFAQAGGICARAWRYAIAVSEGMKAVK
jgi:soluble lytic murein transglycosylase-like protein